MNKEDLTINTVNSLLEAVEKVISKYSGPASEILLQTVYVNISLALFAQTLSAIFLLVVIIFSEKRVAKSSLYKTDKFAIRLLIFFGAVPVLLFFLYLIIQYIVYLFFPFSYIINQIL